MKAHEGLPADKKQVMALPLACAAGAVQPIDVQPPGGKAMGWADWLRGRRIGAGAIVEPAFPATGAP